MLECFLYSLYLRVHFHLCLHCWPLFDIFFDMIEQSSFPLPSLLLHYGKIINICYTDIRRSHACLNGPLFSHLWGSTSLFQDLWSTRSRMHSPAVSPSNYLFWFLWQQSFLSSLTIQLMLMIERVVVLQLLFLSAFMSFVGTQNILWWACFGKSSVLISLEWNPKTIY